MVTHDLEHVVARKLRTAMIVEGVSEKSDLIAIWEETLKPPCLEKCSKKICWKGSEKFDFGEGLNYGGCQGIRGK